MELVYPTVQVLETVQVPEMVKALEQGPVPALVREPELVRVLVRVLVLVQGQELEPVRVQVVAKVRALVLELAQAQEPVRVLVSVRECWKLNLPYKTRNFLTQIHLLS